MYWQFMILCFCSLWPLFQHKEKVRKNVNTFCYKIKAWSVSTYYGGDPHSLLRKCDDLISLVAFPIFSNNNLTYYNPQKWIECSNNWKYILPWHRDVLLTFSSSKYILAPAPLSCRAVNSFAVWKCDLPQKWKDNCLLSTLCRTDCERSEAILPQPDQELYWITGGKRNECKEYLSLYSGDGRELVNYAGTSGLQGEKEITYIHFITLKIYI